jgi:hypothetical protein
MFVDGANSRSLILKGVVTCQNRTAACTARAVWGGHEFIQEEEVIDSVSHSPRVGQTTKNGSFALGFNDRTPQLRAVADFFVKRELMMG